MIVNTPIKYFFILLFSKSQEIARKCVTFQEIVTSHINGAIAFLNMSFAIRNNYERNVLAL